jgi:4-amino-4-deoxy-L-arabinose transferase-like glycosyltransferase
MIASLSRRTWWLVLLAIGIAWFAMLDVRVLLHPDEGRYAEIAREMAVTGDWVTPRLNGLKYFEKPPLQYWATAAAFRLFEVDQWTARLAPALAGFLAVVAVGLTSARLAGLDAGMYAALVLSGCLLHIALAHFLTLDAMLEFWLTGGLCAFLLAQRDGLSPGRQRAFMLVAYAAIAAATLTKGLVALVIPGATLVIYTLVTRDGSPWKRLHALPGLALFLALTVPWFVLVASANPEFAQFFFVHEHFDRFLTTEHRRTGGWYYFIPLLLFGILPWLPMFAWTLRRSWRDAASATASGFSWPRFCLVWAGFVFAFFSLSGSKLPSYILPMFPPLAMVIGWQLTKLRPRELAWLCLPLAVGSVIALLAMLLYYDDLAARLAEPENPIALFRRFGGWLKLTLAIFALGNGLAVWLFFRATPASKSLGVAVLCLASLYGFQTGFHGYDTFRATRSSFDLVASARKAAGGAFDAAAPVFVVHTYDQTLPFYLGRTVTLVDYRDEMALGLDAEPEKGIAAEGEWVARWIALPQGYALLPLADYERLRSENLPMLLLASDLRRAFVARR